MREVACILELELASRPACYVRYYLSTAKVTKMRRVLYSYSTVHTIHVEYYTDQIRSRRGHLFCPTAIGLVYLPYHKVLRRYFYLRGAGAAGAQLYNYNSL